MARTVSFAAPERARDANYEETDLMKTFHQHVKNCDDCYECLRYDETSLCRKGYGYMQDMQPYFYCKSSKPYSLIERDPQQPATRVLVPPQYKYFTDLFVSLNRNANLKPRKPVIVHQTSAPAVQRPQPIRQERPTIVIPQRERYTSSPVFDRSPRYEERRPREPRYRGSLYHDDQRRRTRQDADYVIASPRRHHL